MKRPCDRTWREILDWAWENGAEEFTHRELLDLEVVSYRGSRKNQVWSASSTLRRMCEAGLLNCIASGSGRRAGVYSPITREEYNRMLKKILV